MPFRACPETYQNALSALIGLKDASLEHAGRSLEMRPWLLAAWPTSYSLAFIDCRADSCSNNLAPSQYELSTGCYSGVLSDREKGSGLLAVREIIRVCER